MLGNNPFVTIWIWRLRGMLTSSATLDLKAPTSVNIPYLLIYTSFQFFQGKGPKCVPMVVGKLWKGRSNLLVWWVFVASTVASSSSFLCYLGFSRGAYQVRVIAGMIERVCPFPDSCCTLILCPAVIQVGLLYKGNNEQIPLYALLRVISLCLVYNWAVRTSCT